MYSFSFLNLFGSSKAIAERFETQETLSCLGAPWSKRVFFYRGMTWIKQKAQILKHMSFPAHYLHNRIYRNLLWTISGILPLSIHLKGWKSYQTAALVSQQLDLEGRNSDCCMVILPQKNSDLLEEVVHSGNWLWWFQVGDLWKH